MEKLSESPVMTELWLKVSPHRDSPFIHHSFKVLYVLTDNKAALEE